MAGTKGAAGEQQGLSGFWISSEVSAGGSDELHPRRART